MTTRHLITFLVFFFTTSALAAPGDIYYVDQSHISASDSNPGTEALPWKTIQKAADSLTAGETVFVKEGTYTELTGSTGKNNGIIPRNSGTSGNPITYQAYPEHHVIIDQNRLGMGFYIVGKSYITIRSFEMKNLYSAGVRTEDQSSNSFITIDRNYIHHIGGEWGHNVGGVRLDSCSQCIVSNNIIHDSWIDQDPQTNSAGIHSYRMSDALIENNEIWNSHNGIFFKQAEFSGKSGGTIRRNIFHHISEGIRLTPQGSGFPGHQEITVTENIFYKFSRGLFVRVSESSTVSSGLYIYNNTFDDGVPYTGTPTPECFVINGYTNVQIWNNICTVGVPIETQYITTPSNYQTDISYMDFNLYPSSTSFRVDRYGNYLSPPISYQIFSNLSDWKNNAISSPTVSVNPDTNTINDDPLFVSSKNRNYKLQGLSPARNSGRTGEHIGAYSNDSIFIGAPKPDAVTSFKED